MSSASKWTFERLIFINDFLGFILNTICGKWVELICVIEARNHAILDPVCVRRSLVAGKIKGRKGVEGEAEMHAVFSCTMQNIRVSTKSAVHGLDGTKERFSAS